MIRFCFLLFTIALAATLPAAPLQRELGSGLLYLRVRELPGDLPAKPVGRPPPLIVDVRYFDASAESAAAFGEWLNARATPRSPVFVLANAETSRPLLRTLALHPRGVGIAVVGIERGGFRPDIAVKGSADEERRAYDALEKGAEIATLLADNPNKVRNDEASLSKDRLAEAAADAATEKKQREMPPIDLVLQRAMHLHRALVALKRI